MTLSVHSNSIKWALLAVVVSLVAACSIYKPDITQGNIITTEQVSELKLGMSRQQVQQILGSPLLQDTFNTNRWDYVYRFLKGNGSLEQRVMTVFFDANGKLERWSGLVAPEQKDISLKPLSPAKTLAVLSPSATPASTASLSAEVIASGSNQSFISPAPLLERAAVTSPQPQPIAVQAPVSVAVNTPAIASPAPEIVSQIATSAPISSKSPLLSPDIETVIGTSIAAWRSAWMSKDLARYKAAYAANHAGELASNDAWFAQRKRIIESAGDISITLSDIRVIQTSATDARATFTQNYKSSRLSEAGTKNLFFQRNGDAWLIVAERFIKQ